MKLVRDRIPSIIALEGHSKPLIEQRIPKISKADPELFPRLLEAKLLEELGEYMREPREPSELVDILEVVYALAELHGWSAEELNIRRQHKLALKGGFENRIVLHR